MRDLSPAVDRAGQPGGAAAVYTEWVRLTALGSVLSAALAYGVTQVLFAGPPPKPLFVEMLALAASLLPIAIAQATVLWRRYRVSRASYLLLTVLPGLLLSSAVLGRLLAEPGAGGLDASGMTPVLREAQITQPGWIVLGLMANLGASAVVGVIFAVMQWVAIRERANGLNFWLGWNAVGGAAVGLLIGMAFSLFGPDAMVMRADGSYSPLYFAVITVGSMVSNLLIGIGVARLSQRPPDP